MSWELLADSGGRSAPFLNSARAGNQRLLNTVLHCAEEGPLLRVRCQARISCVGGGLSRQTHKARG